MATIQQIIKRRLYGCLIRKINAAIMARIIDSRIMRDRCVAGTYEWKYYQSKINVLNDLMDDIDNLMYNYNN